MADDQELMRQALTTEAGAQRALLTGDEAAAADGFAAAADLYRRSWEQAPPRAYGRLIGMLKATILSGAGLEEAAEYAQREVPDPDSPPSWYVCGLASAIQGETGAMRNAAEGMRAASDAFGRAADALHALAEGDRDALDSTLRAIHADFDAREEHLTGVPIADTAIMFERLAARAP